MESALLKLLNLKVHSFLSLSKYEQFFCLYISLWLLFIKFVLTFFSFNTVFTYVNKKNYKKRNVHLKRLSAERICELIEKCSSNLPLHITCLPAAITGYIVCKANGHDPKIKIGAKKIDTEAIVAHAWL